MIVMLAESALRALVLAAAVFAALKLLKVEGAEAQRFAWVLVLFASLSMPLLMQARVDLPLLPAEKPTLIEQFVAVDAPVAALPQPATESAPAPATVAVTWPVLLLGAYLSVAGLLLARLFAGLLNGWRLAREAIAAVPAKAGLDIRLHEDVQAPMAFGPIILVPADFAAWPPDTQRAVLAHEAAHVRHHDFAVQALAALNRAVFWFNPLSWWLKREIARLAECISDDAAIAELDDRPHYAEILLGISQGAPAEVPGVAMASANVRERIDRVLSENLLMPRLSARARILLSASLVPLIAVTSATGLKAKEAPKPEFIIRTMPNPLKPIPLNEVKPDIREVAAPSPESFLTDPLASMQSNMGAALAHFETRLADAGAAMRNAADPARGEKFVTQVRTPIIKAEKVQEGDAFDVYAGNARYIDGQAVIRADMLRLEKENGKASRLAASGDVTVMFGNNVLQGAAAEFQFRDDRLQLTDVQPQLTPVGDQIAAQAQAIAQQKTQIAVDKARTDAEKTGADVTKETLTRIALDQNESETSFAPRPRPADACGEALEALHEKGRADIGFVIGTDGIPHDVKIVESSGSAGFDAVALQCQQNARYQPAMRNGSRVDYGMSVTVEWPRQENRVTAVQVVPNFRYARLIPSDACNEQLAVLGVNGSATLSYVIGTDGVPHDVKVVVSSGSADFDAIAVQCRQAARFDPIMINDIPVEFRTVDTVSYRTPPR